METYVQALARVLKELDPQLSNPELRAKEAIAKLESEGWVLIFHAKEENG